MRQAARVRLCHILLFEILFISVRSWDFYLPQSFTKQFTDGNCKKQLYSAMIETSRFRSKTGNDFLNNFLRFVGLTQILAIHLRNVC